jgi:hypothetical protein
MQQAGLSSSCKSYVIRTPTFRRANSFRCLEIGFQLVMLGSVLRKWVYNWGIGIQGIPILRTIGMDSLLVLFGCSGTFPSLRSWFPSLMLTSAAPMVAVIVYIYKHNDLALAVFP